MGSNIGLVSPIVTVILVLGQKQKELPKDFGQKQVKEEGYKCIDDANMFKLKVENYREISARKVTSKDNDDKLLRNVSRTRDILPGKL